ncbi:MAG: hypothetical protein RQ753_08030 [Desulfurivibrionaceae bacterium]|nr:cytochrome b5 domain-containing protein [Desulfobulbales bacterium]MDT8335632.1 hypothetical protein [Desulfurivibrionaceae bacterium]
MMKGIGIIWVILSLHVFFAAPLFATEQYAAMTGAECEACHVDPLGGGELTAVGKGYFLAANPGTRPEIAGQGNVARVIRLIIGYIHIVTAFLWFGTILYVHLVLKPAYASTGLPRSEVKVGLVSIIIMAITGIVLTYYKVPSPGLLLSSQFGILLLAKIVIFTIMVSTALFVVLFIGPRLKTKKAVRPVQPDGLSLAELANFDGREGRPAYFAFKGKIYDATGSKLWKSGSHMKRHQAGVDLTGFLTQAPHGEEKLSALPEIAPLSTTREKPAGEIHKRVFYVMAYMNLGFVFIVTLILALWRWY